MATKWILGLDAGGSNVKIAPISVEGGHFLAEPLIVPNTSFNSLEDIRDFLKRFLDENTHQFGKPLGIAISSVYANPDVWEYEVYGRGGETFWHHWSGKDPQADLESFFGLPVSYAHDVTALNAAAADLEPTGRTVALSIGTYLSAGYIVDGIPLEEKKGFWELVGPSGTMVKNDLPHQEKMWVATGIAVSLRYAMEKLNHANGFNRQWPEDLEKIYLSNGMLPIRDEAHALLRPYCDDPDTYFIDPSEIFKRAEQGDIDAQNVLAELGEHLASDLQEIYDRWPFDSVVIGGGLAEAHKYFDKAIEKSARDIGVRVTFPRYPIAIGASGAVIDVSSRIFNQLAAPFLSR